MKRSINKHGKKLIILMALMILTLSFALFSDSKVNELDGQMHTLGIETELDGNLEDLLLPGDEVELDFTVWQNETYTTNGVTAKAADARVRHLIEIIGTENVELAKAGAVKISFDGKDLDFTSATHTTDSYKVEPGATAKDLGLKIKIAESVMNPAQAAEFEIKIITEAIQWKHTSDADFNGSNVQIVSDIVASRGYVAP